MSRLYFSAHLVYEIERVCSSQDPYKLIEAYTASINYFTKHNLTEDSELIKEDESKTYLDMHGI